MTEGRTVLIAVDGSSHSEHAFNWYVKTLYHEGDKLFAVVCPQYNYRLSATCIDEIDRDKVKKVLDEEDVRVKETVKKFENLIKETKIDGEVKTSGGSTPGYSIVEMAKNLDVSFIVIGSRGRGVKRNTSTGNVCDYVVKHAHVPVMISKHGNLSK